MSAKPAPTHDLLRVRTPTSLVLDAPAPPWLEQALGRTPWVVVRRGYVVDGRIPVGVRGSSRHERFAAFLPFAEIVERLSPEDLIDSRYVIDPLRKEQAPAIDALFRVVPLLKGYGFRWGPGGSVGFEIATGVATATPSSDLDLVLRLDRRFELSEAIDLLAEMTAAAVPVRIDVLLETPRGGVSLAEFAAAPAKLLVRTPDGARLLVNPWRADARLEECHVDRVSVPGPGGSERRSASCASATS